MIEKTEILRRRDMREVFTFTIDPADAKDFDDAISFEVISEESSESYSSKPSCPGLRLRVPNTLRTLLIEFIPHKREERPPQSTILTKKEREENERSL